MKKILVHSQKIYVYYTLLLWFLWCLMLGLTQISGTAFDVKNEQLFFVIHDISAVVYWISVVPVVPVLWVIATVESAKNKKVINIIFNLISFVVSVVIWFIFLVNHIVNMCGGV